MSEVSNNPVSDSLLKILACPVCKASVEIIKTKRGENGLICSECKRIYPIRDGIPVMLESEAFINGDS